MDEIRELSRRGDNKNDQDGGIGSTDDMQLFSDLKSDIEKLKPGLDMNVTMKRWSNDQVQSKTEKVAGRKYENHFLSATL